MFTVYVYGKQDVSLEDRRIGALEHWIDSSGAVCKFGGSEEEDRSVVALE